MQEERRIEKWEERRGLILKSQFGQLEGCPLIQLVFYFVEDLVPSRIGKRFKAYWDAKISEGL